MKRFFGRVRIFFAWFVTLGKELCKSEERKSDNDGEWGRMEEGKEEGGRRREEEGGRGKEVRGRRKGGRRRKKGWREEEIIYLGLHRRACFRCIGELFWDCLKWIYIYRVRRSCPSRYLWRGFFLYKALSDLLMLYFWKAFRAYVKILSKMQTFKRTFALFYLFYIG